MSGCCAFKRRYCCIMGVVPGRSAEGLWPSLLLSEDGRFGRSIQLADAFRRFGCHVAAGESSLQGSFRPLHRAFGHVVPFSLIDLETLEPNLTPHSG